MIGEWLIAGGLIIDAFGALASWYNDDLGDFEDAVFSINLAHNPPVICCIPEKDIRFSSHLSDYGNHADEYIDDWYTSRGWVALFLGFLIQLLGIVI